MNAHTKLVFDSTKYFDRMYFKTNDFNKDFNPEQDFNCYINELLIYQNSYSYVFVMKVASIINTSHSFGRLPKATIAFSNNSNDGFEALITINSLITYCDDNSTYIEFTCNQYFLVKDGELHENGVYEDFFSDSKVMLIDEVFIDECVNTMQQDSWFKDMDYKPKKRHNTESDNFKQDILKSKQESVPAGDSGVEIFNANSLNITQGSLSPMGELNKIIGLNNVKQEIQKLKAKLEYDVKREERGIVADKNISNHMVFVGNPGTGKTTVARIMTGVLYGLKCIKQNKLVEVSGLDLIGGFIGQTQIITERTIDIAKGGVLFIDEAYALAEEKKFGKEAVSVLLKEIEDNRGDLVVIFAGYKDDMEVFFDMNSGFKSRVNKTFGFKDYSQEELVRIFMSFMRKKHLRVEKEALKKIANIFNVAKNRPKFSNGRFARNLSEKIEEEHIMNLNDVSDENRNDTITLEDVPDSLIEYMLDNI